MLESLNDYQKEAVLHKEGPLLILAGAGSGKTRVLTTKIAYLIKEYDVDARNILAITFTNKAAKEMKTRIEELIGKTSIQASTFHSFGVKILKENCEKLGYKSNFIILDSDDSLTLVKKILKDFNLDPKRFSPYMIRNKISSNKNELIMPDDYKKFVYNEEDDVVYKVYKKYQEILKQNNSLDFDDLLILPITLFKKNPDVLAYYQDCYRYIFIDEYQDTNYAQYLLTKMISAKYHNICVVGDNDQSIYAFRGANYKNILNFEKDYPDCKVVMLEQNYRSTKTILNAANSVIKNNKERKDKNLWSLKESNEKITYYKAADETDEVHYILKKVKELVASGVSYQDMAILYRTNAQSRVFEQELLKQNIPYRIIGSFYFYSRKEIKDLLAYMRLVYNPDDDLSLLRVINTPKRGIGNKTLRSLEEEASLYHTSLFQAINSGKELAFKELILTLQKDLEKMTLTEFVDNILEKTGMRRALKEEKTLEADIRLEYLEEFKSVTKMFESRVGEVSLADFLLEISLVADSEEYKDDPNRLTLMTVHAVKGLEFSYVFLAGLEEGIFPHRNSMDTLAELEEERRLMYVAITRAKDKLFITSAKKRMLFGQENIAVPSRFIKEIDSSLIDLEEKENMFTSINKRVNNFYDEDKIYNYGDKIKHEKYGLGVVIEVAGDFITVAFNKNVGIKKLLKNHKSITKVE